MRSLLAKILEKNLLLFERRADYLVINSARLIGIVVLGLLAKLLWCWNPTGHGVDTLYVINVLVALFAVGLACFFYIAANQAGAASQRQLQAFLTDMRNEQRTQMASIHATLQQKVYGAPEVPATTERPQQPELAEEPLDSMEKQILNTLFTKQVNRWPTWTGQVWSFRINANAPDFYAFVQARSKLIARGLVSETNEGHLVLTTRGFNSCRQQYNDIKDAPQWWPEEKMDGEKLRVALSE